MIEVNLLKGGNEVRFDGSSIAELGEHRCDAGRWRGGGGRNIWTVKGLEVQGAPESPRSPEYGGTPQYSTNDYKNVRGPGDTARYRGRRRQAPGRKTHTIQRTTNYNPQETEQTCIAKKCGSFMWVITQSGGDWDRSSTISGRSRPRSPRKRPVFWRGPRIVTA